MTKSQRLFDLGSKVHTDLPAAIRDLGGEREHLYLLDDDGPELLPYATLLTARQDDDSVLKIVRAVYEWQEAPLLYLVPEEAVESPQQLERVRRLLAMRGDAPYLGVVGTGRLEVYQLALDSKTLKKSIVDWAGSDTPRPEAFARLGNLRPRANINRNNWISDVLLKLLDASIDSIIKTEQISNEDAISLIGRALFVRFLGDRSLLPQELIPSDGDATLFDNSKSAEATSGWLDRTFNGDFLPLSKGIFQQLSPAAYKTLGDVLRRAPAGQQMLGWEIKWANLDFSHIPVGVLSQAYELYLREHAPAKQKKEGGYYTPRLIADLMVRASFRALKRQDNTHKAKVLDPAAGAGVFLLTAFRQLVAEHWRVTGQRPTTPVLRKLLYDQIVGFDINESALRFAALGLYLMSIELDPNPVPVDKLKFENLKGKVLHLVLDAKAEVNQQLGSLGPQVGSEHNGRYDLVVGNPPWASRTGLENFNLVEETVGRISAARRESETRPSIPKQVLDLPFVWRAMEWAKPDGQIALALHARFLFQGEKMFEMRQAIFEALDVTSVINGVELRQTKVWPKVLAPFCILFATNRTSRHSAGFRLVSPRFEESLNSAGNMRIDTANAEVVSVQQLSTTPEILKILFRGSKADLSLLERIWNQNHPTLREFWRETIGGRDKKDLWGSGYGYQKVRDSSPVDKKDGLPGVSGEYLWGIDEITLDSFDNSYTSKFVDKKFDERRLHRRTHESIFYGPLLIAHKSPSARKKRIGVIFRTTDTVYSETFYGYSVKNYSDDSDEAKRLGAYFACILGSKFTLWYMLMVSGEFGVEREVIEKAVLDTLPIPKFETLDKVVIDQAVNLTKGVEDGTKSWDEVDDWTATLFNLSERDLQVINDTLEFNLPFAENKSTAQTAPSSSEQELFCQALLEELTPWSKRMGASITVKPYKGSHVSPWLGIAVQNTAHSNSRNPSQEEWEGLVRAADDTASSELLIRGAEGNLLIGRLAQRRYWSVTQARLLAQRIVGSHLDLFRQRALS